jgi:hypothetical protein
MRESPGQNQSPCPRKLQCEPSCLRKGAPETDVVDLERWRWAGLGWFAVRAGSRDKNDLAVHGLGFGQGHGSARLRQWNAF